MNPDTAATLARTARVLGAIDTVITDDVYRAAVERLAGVPGAVGYCGDPDHQIVSRVTIGSRSIHVDDGRTVTYDIVTEYAPYTDSGLCELCVPRMKVGCWAIPDEPLGYWVGCSREVTTSVGLCAAHYAEIVTGEPVDPPEPRPGMSSGTYGDWALIIDDPVTEASGTGYASTGEPWHEGNPVVLTIDFNVEAFTRALGDAARRIRDAHATGQEPPPDDLAAWLDGR